MALPVNVKDWPARNVVPAGGLEMLATGGWFAGGVVLDCSQCLKTPYAGSLPKKAFVHCTVPDSVLVIQRVSTP